MSGAGASRRAGVDLRVGIAGFSCECCTFSPLTTARNDFAVTEGEALLGSYGCLADHADVEFVPLLRARALPGGSIERAFYDETRRRLLDGLAGGRPWDGLLLHLHGAAHVVGMDDAEGDLLEAVRDVVGPRCLISASYDLHGNVSERVMRNLDILTAYRTAPHVDTEETVARACDLLTRCLRRRRSPVQAFVPVPILLPGEKTSTEWDPGDRLYAAIPDVIDRHGILDASVLMGYPWADEARAGASVVACGQDPDSVQRAATELARLLWDARTEFRFGSQSGSPDECIRAAAETAERPVVISDSGDNPTAGGAGDVPFVLERLLAFDVADAVYAGIADPDAVAECRRAGVGSVTELALGGKLDPVHGRPLSVRAEVVAIHEDLPSLDGRERTAAAVLQVGGVQVIVTERRRPFHRIADFEQLGIDVQSKPILAVKIGYLEPELKRLAAKSLLALGPGAVTQDLESLPFRRIRRPIFPLDPDASWSPPERSLV